MTVKKNRHGTKPNHGNDDIISSSNDDSDSSRSDHFNTDTVPLLPNTTTTLKQKRVSHGPTSSNGSTVTQVHEPYPILIQGSDYITPNPTDQLGSKSLNDTPIKRRSNLSTFKRPKKTKGKKHNVAKEDTDTAKLIEELATILLLPMGDEQGTAGIFIDYDDGDTDNDSYTDDGDSVASWPRVDHNQKKNTSRKDKGTRELEAKLAHEEKLIKAYIREHSFDYANQDLRKQILLMDAHISIKAMLLTKYDDIHHKKGGLSFGNSADKAKYQAWIKDVLSVPFGKTKSLPVTISDGPEKIYSFLNNMKDKMNAVVAGHDAAKDEIIDYVARIISNPQSKGNILALSGDKGIGKTRLLKRGVADALDRPFHVINLGGLNDVHVLSGHDMTYSGAKYGKLAHILIQSKCENPIIYLDEIDKIQATSDKGMEIFRVLTHILDEEQNSEFFDEYFGGVPIDLSKILFVASMNNPDDVEPVLRDRLKIIYLDKLRLEEKMTIAYKHVLPELLASVNLNSTLLTISDDVLRYLITSKTHQEDGCRQMKKNLETIVQKLNTMRITQTGFFEQGNIPIVLKESHIDQLLHHVKVDNHLHLSHMYT